MAIKLSNQQVLALAGKIKEKLVAIKVTPIIEANDSIYTSDEYKNFETWNEDCITLKNLEKKYDLDSYNIDRACNNIRREFFKSQIQSVPSISTDAIIQEIHLATIEASDLNSMIEAITEKLK